jgi:L-seryl-tRNA(Ser) seleniumtransferase
VAIAAATGAEAGYVASGAAACLLLGTAACVAGLEPSRMARLPDTAGMKDEVVVVRSQRNFYDHAVRAAGVRLVEVGLPDRYAGAGVRDAEPWEIADAISPRTAAVFYVAHRFARPSLSEVVSVAHAAGVPVLVDAAAELPPQANLRRFIAEGADLVAFSGGKAIGGPQASGMLCGRRDLIMSAALQHLDLDIFWAQWSPPGALIDKARLRGIPQHGIGRPCKVGKEEIVGLLAAVERYLKVDLDAERRELEAKVAHLKEIVGRVKGVIVETHVPEIANRVPHFVAAWDEGEKKLTAQQVHERLQAGDPPIHVLLMGPGRLMVSVWTMSGDEHRIVARRLREILG